jgi:hypothetical protein
MEEADGREFIMLNQGRAFGWGSCWRWWRP